ncbi:hypothetical protein ACFQ1I_27900 [Kitasatospora arboriphila]
MPGTRSARAGGPLGTVTGALPTSGLPTGTLTSALPTGGIPQALPGADTLGTLTGSPSRGEPPGRRALARLQPDRPAGRRARRHPARGPARRCRRHRRLTAPPAARRRAPERGRLRPSVAGVSRRAGPRPRGPARRWR